MNTAVKTSLRIFALPLALGAGLVIGTLSSAAIAQPASDTYLSAGTPPVSGRIHRRVDVVRAPETRRGGGPRRGDTAAFALSYEPRIDFARAPETRRGGAPRRGEATAFALSSEPRIDVVRAPETRRGNAPDPAGGGMVGLAAGY